MHIDTTQLWKNSALRFTVVLDAEVRYNHSAHARYQPAECFLPSDAAAFSPQQLRTDPRVSRRWPCQRIVALVAGDDRGRRWAPPRPPGDSRATGTRGGRHNRRLSRRYETSRHRRASILGWLQQRPATGPARRHGSGSTSSAMLRWPAVSLAPRRLRPCRSNERSLRRSDPGPSRRGRCKARSAGKADLQT